MSVQHDNLSRKQREFLQREQLILDTAQNMLHQNGYVQLTMERIAEAVEYSKGTIYNHFASKEDIFQAVFSITSTFFLKGKLKLSCEKGE